MTHQLDSHQSSGLLHDPSELVEYRLAIADDFNQLLQLEANIFAADGWDAATLRHFLGCRSSRWQIATSGAEIIGYSMYLIESGNTIHIGNLAVVEAHRRKGIGQALLALMLNEAAKLPASKVYLEVAADSSGAISLYRAAGFVESRILPRYYANADAIEMVRQTQT